MVEQSDIRQHSLFQHFYQAGEKLFINSSLVNGSATDRKAWPAVNGFLGKIYAATHSIPAVGSIINNINSPAKVEVIRVYYSIYKEDVLITIEVKIVS